MRSPLVVCDSLEIRRVQPGALRKSDLVCEIVQRCVLQTIRTDPDGTLDAQGGLADAFELGAARRACIRKKATAKTARQEDVNVSPLCAFSPVPSELTEDVSPFLK